MELGPFDFIVAGALSGEICAWFAGCGGRSFSCGGKFTLEGLRVELVGEPFVHRVRDRNAHRDQGYGGTMGSGALDSSGFQIGCEKK